MKNLTKVMAIGLIGMQALANSGGENPQKLPLSGLKTIAENVEQVEETLVRTNPNACEEQQAEKLKLPLSDLITVEEDAELIPSEIKVGVFPGAERKL